MFKRLFWFALGFSAGVITVAKAQSYVRANTPDTARQFLLGSDQNNVAIRTLEGLIADFNTARLAREQELEQRYNVAQ